MSQAHDHRAALSLELVDLLLRASVHVLARSERETGNVLRTGLRLRFGRCETEHAHLRAVAQLEHRVCLRERLTRRIDGDVRGEHGEVRLRDERFEVVGSPIEFVVADRHGIVSCRIHEIDGGFALRKVHEHVVLDGVAVVEEQHFVALLLVVFLDLGDRRHPDDPGCGIGRLGGHVVAMRVVGVDDGELRLGGLRLPLLSPARRRAPK